MRIVDVSPLLQILEVPVPQMDQLVEFMKIHDAVTPEQVVAVSKISCHSVLFVRFSVSCRRRSSWWKCLLSCLRFFSSSCRTLTFQFPALVVSLATEVFKVSSQNGVLILLTSRPSTFQFQGVGVQATEVFKVFTQDKVRCSVLSSSLLTFLFLVEVLMGFSLILGWQLHPRSFAWCFSHYSSFEKKCGGCRAGGCEGARAPELIHAELSSSGSAVHGCRL